MRCHQSGGAYWRKGVPRTSTHWMGLNTIQLHVTPGSKNLHLLDRQPRGFDRAHPSPVRVWHGLASRTSQALPRASFRASASTQASLRSERGSAWRTIGIRSAWPWPSLIGTNCPFGPSDGDSSGDCPAMLHVEDNDPAMVQSSSWRVKTKAWVRGLKSTEAAKL